MTQVDDLLGGQASGDIDLRIEAAPWASMVGWARATDMEVSGLALIAADVRGLRLTDAFLLRQSVTAYETTLDPDDVAALVGRLIDDGVDPAVLRVWWHSHAREAPFWSGVDERTIESFSPSPMLSIVIDHRLRRLARVDQFEPRRTIWVNLELPAPATTGPDDVDGYKDAVAGVVTVIARPSVVPGPVGRGADVARVAE